MVEQPPTGPQQRCRLPRTRAAAAPDVLGHADARSRRTGRRRRRGSPGRGSRLVGQPGLGDLLAGAARPARRQGDADDLARRSRWAACRARLPQPQPTSSSRMPGAGRACGRQVELGLCAASSPTARRRSRRAGVDHRRARARAGRSRCRRRSGGDGCRSRRRLCRRPYRLTRISSGGGAGSRPHRRRAPARCAPAPPDLATDGPRDSPDGQPPRASSVR